MRYQPNNHSTYHKKILKDTDITASFRTKNNEKTHSYSKYVIRMEQKV